MNHNSVYSHVKRNNNNSESVDGDEQCSSNVQVAPNPKRTNVIQLSKLGNGTTHISDTSSFFQILNLADPFQKCNNN